MQTISSPTPASLDPRCDDDTSYRGWLERIQARFNAVTADAKSLHVATASKLWDAYLSGFSDADTRKYHDCWTCQSFINSFGALVVVDDDGVATSALWDVSDAPDLYKPSVAAMLERITADKRVSSPFFSDVALLGKAEAGGWAHLSLELPDKFVVMPGILTAHQVAAGKAQARAAMKRALNEFSPAVVKRALVVLGSDALYRGEAVMGPAQFLSDLHSVMTSGLPDYAKHNLVWRAATEAPEGFLHPRSSMIGTLLVDLADSSLTLDDVKKRFAAKMHPLDYRRPQVAPKAGNIARGETIIEKLGLARSLERRFARLHEIEAIWRPPVAPAEPNGKGVFAHVKASNAKPALQDHSSSEAVAITYVKFRDTVLPGATSIDALVTHGNQPFAAFLTALYDDAPPIIKWDKPGARNPFTWYTWGNRTESGSPPSQWGLTSGWIRVTAVSRSPAEWGMPKDAQPVSSYRSAMFVLEGAVDSRDDGNALFPEMLIPELHEISPTIEAYAKTAKIHGRAQGSAGGLMVTASGCPRPVIVRVTSEGVTQSYKIDRWD